MGSIMLWLNLHRVMVVLVIALGLWGWAYYWYFGPLVRAYFTKGQPHNWSVDLASKKAVARGKTEV